MRVIYENKLDVQSGITVADETGTVVPNLLPINHSAGLHPHRSEVYRYDRSASFTIALGIVRTTGRMTKLAGFCELTKLERRIL
ncbi:unnamed protein product [Clavelina lepadiformis]|uniref:Uncharacterized protein n=1 Tax=Clavelina lepadiformis TaxID=159417 RepID=A0ABP0FE47_CLALP